ncbi:Adenylyl cyclase class-4/guanylyl cyclase,Periplasmic binding protein-like I,Receptor [Cinara cedri]|uniref:Adenylyl cyclase class-4/guanylyl cyclase,Periplasmic binding protein-like I,Receptor n=1 Tax=Cinara cedri TaxID=506608 RepID=A0A5E4MI90_9HEMI|nr:Adenylyl cyclase class-4/guanylyl cyclase,Periplasmic binding protein-like I,Receptor [Cinara cedri]
MDSRARWLLMVAVATAVRFVGASQANCVAKTPAVWGTVRFAIIAPLTATSPNEESLHAILPSIHLASEAIFQPGGSLPNWKMQLNSRDDKCSSTDGGLASFDLHTDSDVFFGPVCDYVIAPVARYAGAWNMPLLTVGAQAENFHNQKEYPTLTRMMGSYKLVGEALRHILHVFGWNVAGLLYFNTGHNSELGNSQCYFVLSAVWTALGQVPNYYSFNDTANSETYKELLNTLSNSSRIIVLCADPSMVREILLAAEELNMIDSGEYVFFNIELFSR